MRDDKTMKEAYQVLERLLEKKLGMPTGTFSALANESDWSVAIKCAVVAEAALGEALERALTRDERESLGTSRQSGLGPKIRLAKSHGLLNREQRDGLYSLMKVRNFCAHNTAGLAFRFDKYYKANPSEITFSALCLRMYTPSPQDCGGERRALPEPATPGIALIAFLIVCCVQLLATKRPGSARLH